MYTNKITFKNGLSVFLPAISSPAGAEKLASLILSHIDQDQAEREVLQSLQTLGARIIHTFLDAGDTYTIMAGKKTLLSKWVDDCNG